MAILCVLALRGWEEIKIELVLLRKSESGISSSDRASVVITSTICERTWNVSSESGKMLKVANPANRLMEIPIQQFKRI